MFRLTPIPHRRLAFFAAAVLCLGMSSGCGNPVDQLLTDEVLRLQLWDKVARNPELSGQFVDRLLGDEATRAALIERVMTGGGSRQAMLMRVANDRTLLEGAIHFAMQDTTRRADLMTLFRGMQMASTP